MTTLNFRDDRPVRLRKPWEVLDEELLPELNVEEIFGDLKKLTRDGPYLKSCCPLHNGPEADAFSVDPERLEWICFVGCGGGGAVQFLQKKMDSNWMQAAQKLAVLAGVDPARLRAWGQHWTEEDFEQHDRLEVRASLLRIFMAMARTLFESKAGQTSRNYLSEQFDSDDDQILEVGLGLYGTASDVFHFLKSSGLDVSDLKAAGFFEPSWQGRIVSAWEDLGGRTINLWSWAPSGMVTDLPAPRGTTLFERDSLGSQKTPFQLSQALRDDVRDLVHFDDPVHAVAARLAGLHDPFPIASNGRLASEQIDTLERALAEQGSLTMVPSYAPKRKRKRGRTATRDEKLLTAAGFPIFMVDPGLMAESRSAAIGPEQFLRQQGLEALTQLLSQSEVLASSEESSRWGLGRVFGGGSKFAGQRPRPTRMGTPESHVPAFLAAVMNAAEEIGSRIAQGFLKAMPGQSLNVPQQLPPVEGERQLRPATSSEAGPEAGSLPSSPAGGLLPPAPESPPESFSVDRLERRTLESPLAKSTGWRAVDEMEVRFRPGELTIIGAESGHGRTSFLVGLLLHWLLRNREEFVYYTFDESETQIYHRLLSLLTSIGGLGWSLTRVRNHFSSRKDQGPEPEGREFESLANARDFLRKSQDRLRLVYRSTTEPRRILRELEPLAREKRLGGIFIDSIDGLSYDSAADLTLGTQLKALAVKLNCPVIVSSRTTQLTQKRKAVAQEISRLLVSSPDDWEVLLEKLEACRPYVDEFAPEIEKEADMLIGLLNCASLYPSQSRLPAQTLFEVGLIKNRSGPAGEWVLLALERAHCRLQDLLEK